MCYDNVSYRLDFVAEMGISMQTLKFFTEKKYVKINKVPIHAAISEQNFVMIENKEVC